MKNGRLKKLCDKWEKISSSTLANIISFIAICGFILIVFSSIGAVIFTTTVYPPMKATKVTLINPYNTNYQKEYIGNIDIIEYSKDQNYIIFKDSNNNKVEVSGWLIEVTFEKQ